MKIDPKIQYKTDTGKSPMLELETEHLTGDDLCLFDPE